MTRRTAGATLSLTLIAAAAAVAPTSSQAVDARDWLDRCEGGWSGADPARERVCEVREVTLPASRHLEVDGRANGGVRVEGWDRAEILVQALISVTAGTVDDARSRAESIRLLTDDARVRAEGPSRVGGGAGWSVSYRVYVPRDTDLSLRAQNGGLRVDGVRGRLELDTRNGGIALTDVSGDVRGRTRNGGVTVRLGGSVWDGQGLDVQTTNGSVSLHVPEAYSARIETGTVNGRMETDFPIMVQGTIRRDLSFQLGQGGPPIRLRTTNGAVRIRRL
jgi:hypothetical protein